MNSPEISAAKPSARLIVPPRHPIQTAAVRQWRSWRTGDPSHLKLGTPPVVLAGCGKTTGRIPFPRPAGPKIGLREGLLAASAAILPDLPVSRQSPAVIRLRRAA